MTLYWWMHWFWITAIILQVLASFSWSSSVHASTLPLSPIVQNGHQNGPYLNELPAERELSTLPSQLSTISEPSVRYFLKDLSSDNKNVNVTPDTTPLHQALTKPQVLTSDQSTSEPPDIKSSSATFQTTFDDNVSKENDKFSFKSEGVVTTEVILPSTGIYLFPDINDNDDIAHTSVQNGPLVESSPEKGVEGSKIVWNDKFPGRVDSFHGKHSKVEHADGKVDKESLFDEVPMGDGPYNPTGSFINSTNIRVKTVVSTSKTPEMTTFKELHFTAVDGDREGKMKESFTNATTTERTVLFVTPTTVTDHSGNTNNILHSTEGIHGSNKTDNSTENILEDEYSSTFIVGDNTTFVAKTETGLQENSNRSRSHEENAISAINFDHSNIEESTKVSSSIVQSVIDDSVNSRGKSLTAIAITGIVMGVIVAVGLIGALSCVVYRRRYLNNPQTLNDKCSNPDSSGYIDDSTLRENSEEMYSLDNDSFLNSLEAMTIQNYWTDNVKHTKL